MTEIETLIRLKKDCVNAALRVAGTIPGSNARTRATYSEELANKKFEDYSRSILKETCR